MAMNKCSSVQMFPRNLFDSLFTNCPVPLLLILLLLYHIIFRFAFYNSTSNPNKERQTDRETNTQKHTWWWSSWGPYGVQHVGHDATTREHIKTFHMLLSFFRRRFKGDCFFFFPGSPRRRLQVLHGPCYQTLRLTHFISQDIFADVLWPV